VAVFLLVLLLLLLPCRNVQASEALVAESVKRWKSEEDVVDDITCVVVFLHTTPAPSATPAPGVGPGSTPSLTSSNAGAGAGAAPGPGAVVAPAAGAPLPDHGGTDVDTIQLIPRGPGGLGSHDRVPSGDIPTVNPMVVARAPSLPL
jgi:hypothetical protein